MVSDDTLFLVLGWAAAVWVAVWVAEAVYKAWRGY